MEQDIINIIFLILGMYLGRLSVGNSNSAESPKVPLKDKLNPMEIYKQREEKRIAEREAKIYQANLDNINNYNGSSDGQKEIPKE